MKNETANSNNCNQDNTEIALHGLSRRAFVAGASALVAAGAAAALGSRGAWADASDSSASDASDGEQSAEADASSASYDADTYPRTVTDLSDFEVTIESQPQRVAALLGNSFEHVFFLGAADRVSCKMNMGTNAWMSVVNPDFDSYDIEEFEAESCRNPNVEELISLGVDVVFYWADLAEQKQSMQDSGITVVESNPSGVEFTTVEEWRTLYKREMNLYANVLGGDTIQKASDWCDYADEKLDFVLERTADLSDDERPRIYCIRNQEDGLQCFAKSSYFSMLAEAAGATLVSKDVDTQLSGFATVTMEQVADWDPEIIFMGWLDDTTLITDNEQWAGISAVKSGDVYTLPCSLNSTDWAYYAEMPLELLYVAKIVHPDLFEDVDIISEIKDFYQRFYGVELSDEDAQAMIDRQDPSGEGNDSFSN